MTPQEVYDAWMAFITGGDTRGFDKVLDQLRSGLLVMETTEDGHIIRAAY